MTASTDRRVLIAVCTFNEADNVEPLLRRLTAAMASADILVVDDQSPDGTAARVQTYATTHPDRRIDLIRRSRRGLGGAIATAMRYAVAGPYDVFVNLDADLSHPPEAIPEMVNRLVQEDCEVVIGSRYVAGGRVVGWPWHRRLMSRLVNRFTATVVGLPVADASGSMRAYRVESLSRLELDRVASSQRYAFLQQILLRLHRGGSKMVEVPIVFVDRTVGRSKLSMFEAAASLCTVLAMTWREK